MTPELSALVAAILLLIAQFGVTALRAQRDIGVGYLMSPRDREPSRMLSQSTGRLKRAYENHQEWIVPFAVAVLVVEIADKDTFFTAVCAWLYVAARVLYVPAYVFGWVPARSGIWGVGFGATLLLLGAAAL